MEVSGLQSVMERLGFVGGEVPEINKDITEDAKVTDVTEDAKVDVNADVTEDAKVKENPLKLDIGYTQIPGCQDCQNQRT